MQNFITQSLRKATGIDDGKKGPADITPSKRTQSDNSPISHMNFNNKWSYSTLEYPYDIQTRSDLGHYMLFYINVPNETMYTEAEHAKDPKKLFNVNPQPTDSARKISRRNQQAYSNPTFSIERVNSGKGRVVGDGGKLTSPVKGKPKSQGTAAKELGAERTKRTSDAIVLYMPPSIGVQYTSSYKESEIGAVGGAVLQAGKGMGLQNFKNSVTGSASKSAQQGTEAVQSASPFTAAADIYKREAFASFGQAAKIGDAIGTVDKLSNQAINNFLEAMFTGIGFRKFSYTYRFTPRDEQEASMVDKIIRTFKFHMLPEYNKQTAGRYFTVPSEFDIFYMYRGDENTWMNKIYTCVCTGVDINYTPNQFQTLRPVAHRGGAPMAEMEMKLDFMETKLVTKEDILEGY